MNGISMQVPGELDAAPQESVSSNADIVPASDIACSLTISTTLWYVQ